ncbi:MAG: hypothetical protein ACR2PO_00645 [Methyloligellaceae bacterium]
MGESVSRCGIAAVLCILPMLLAASATEAWSGTRRGYQGSACKTLLSVPHRHLGLGGFYRSRTSARRSAVRVWVAYTRMEYGSAWANFARARRKSIRCLRVPGVRRWWCVARAQPCRR